MLVNQLLGVKTVQESAVLLITFNRPDTTREVLKALQVAKPKRLYVFSDGARTPDEAKICREVRDLVTEMVNWDCDLRRKVSEKNLGCGPGPFAAMNWAVEEEDRIIILEDDCVPSPAFFPYCNYLLNKYLEDERIWIISGNNYCPEYPLPADYAFTRYAHSWGWATWRRCIKSVDLSMNKYHEFKERKLMYSLLPKNEAEFFLKKYDHIYQDKNAMSHIWDFQFGFNIRANYGIGILPRSNLVKNIGYMGTHSEKKSPFHDRAVDDSFKIVIEPECVVPDYLHDRYHFKHHWMKMKNSIPKRIINKIIRTVHKCYFA